MISLGMSRSGFLYIYIYIHVQCIIYSPRISHYGYIYNYIYTMYMYYVYDSDSSSDIYDNMLESYMPTVRIVFKIYITNNDEKEYWNSIYNPGNIQG